LSNGNGSSSSSNFSSQNGSGSTAGNGASARGCSGGGSSGGCSGSSGGSVRRPERREIRARLLVDCCGHYSPIVKQMRGGQKPQAMVLVVGSCADGVPPEKNRCELHGLQCLLYLFKGQKAFGQDKRSPTLEQYAAAPSCRA